MRSRIPTQLLGRRGVGRGYVKYVSFARYIITLLLSFLGTNRPSREGGRGGSTKMNIKQSRSTEIQHIPKQAGEHSRRERGGTWLGVGGESSRWTTPQGQRMSHEGEGAERRTYDVNTKLSQPFFRSFVLCGFLRVPFPATNAISIHHGLNDLSKRGIELCQKNQDITNSHPNWRRPAPLSGAVSVYPLGRLRFLL